jgi:hypothetical protein
MPFSIALGRLGANYGNNKTEPRAIALSHHHTECTPVTALCTLLTQQIEILAIRSATNGMSQKEDVFGGLIGRLRLVAGLACAIHGQKWKQLKRHSFSYQITLSRDWEAIA